MLDPFFKLKRACSHLTKVATAQAQSQAGVFGAQAQVLFIVHELDGCRMIDLSRRLELGKPGLTTLIGRMEKQELIYRTADPRDARAAVLRLTAKGAQAQAGVSKMVRLLDASLVEGFSTNELQTIQSFLDKAASI